MPRRLVIGLTVALLGMPVGVSWAQTSTTSSTTSTTVVSTTTTTLPICIPGQAPAPRPGENCQLPGLECITLNPPPQCPPTPPPNGVAAPFMTTGGTTGTGRTTGGTTPGLARPIPGQPTFTGSTRSSGSIRP